MPNVHSFHPNAFRTWVHIKHMSGSSIAVHMTSAHEFLLGKRSVDLVRMDIEGHEVEVFESIARAVQGGLFRGSILFETHFSKYDDTEHNMRRQLQKLFAFGYIPVLVASNDESRTLLHIMRYRPGRVMRTDGVHRGVYCNVKPEDVVACACDRGGIRTVLLKRV